MKKVFYLIILIIVLGGAAFLYFGNKNGEYNLDKVSDMASSSATISDGAALPDESYKRVDITVPGGTIHALLADNERKMELGLSFRKSLSADSGMLFVFDDIGIYPFWMKDMLFPLDMVWLDETKTVVDITSNLSPLSYPDTVSASVPVKYVLEIPADSAKQKNIATGTILNFSF